MSEYIFVFDLDSTITKQEILPTIAKRIGRFDEMRRLTESAMRGDISFQTSFVHRVNMLSDLRVSEISQMVAEIPLNEELVRFIKTNRDRCYIVTGNLDVWISALLKKLAMEHRSFCSTALVEQDRISEIIQIIEKEQIVRHFPQPLVVIGDGDNDVGMTRYANISIGYGGVRPIAPSLYNCIDVAFYDETTCADYLRSLL